jgi:ABC-2 type transport system permease protein
VSTVEVAYGANPGRLAVIAGEIGKLPAFVRRDFLLAWSYRLAFFSELGAMLLQTVTFYFLGDMISSSSLPTYGGNQVTYMEFVAIGLALSLFMAIALSQVAMAIRTEQMIGTLESVLVTPTAPTTIQIGSVCYALIFIPIRILAFLGIVVLIFGLDFHWDGLGPAIAVLLAFIPFVWGLGLMSAGAILTFKRATAGVGVIVALLTLASGAYFPLTLLPAWAEWLAQYNPLAIATNGMRDSLLGGTGWSGVGPELAALAALSAVAVVAGIGAFRLALGRERRRGTLGLY